MKITETYKNNIKELDKFLKTISFSEESEAKIRQFVDNPLSVLNDDIKALFTRFDDAVVDYRISLPASMLKQEKKYPKDVYLVLNAISDCLSKDSIVLFSTNSSNDFVSNIKLNVETIANNCFYVNGDKRKVWKYLDSKAEFIAKETIKRARFSNMNCVDFNIHTFGFDGFLSNMNEYISTLGTRKTSLKDKINNLNKTLIVNLSDNDEETIKNLIEVIKNIFKISSEILGAKMIDADKFKMYLSFNVFDWLFASTGESFHSCIDMNGSYFYGLGLLGMCGCPDWGMLLYTDDTTKKCFGIETLHIITRSWVCYTEDNDWQIVNWYPKDIRNTVSIESNVDGMSFRLARDRVKSKSNWKPITFYNGGVAWIYSDLNQFKINNDKQTVHFEMGGATGINDLAADENGMLYTGALANHEALRAISNHSHSIGDAIEHGFVLKDYIKLKSIERHRCNDCGHEFSNEEDLTYIESEDIYVCQSCLDNNFFRCEGCDEYHRLDDACEVYYGPHDWEYELRCQGCIENSDGIFWDEVAEKYYFNDCDCYTIYTSNDTIYVSSYTLNDGISRGIYFKHSDDEYYDYAEESDNQ